MSSAHDQVYEAEQVIARPRQEVFAFFSNPRNLEAITPPWLGFRILGKPDAEIREGTLLDYGLRLRGLPIRWRSVIDVWEPGRRYVDIQLRGPYALWHHTHTFADVEGGTRVIDRVNYRLRLGGLGRFLAGRLVRGEVEKIFGFRQERVRQLLEETGPSEDL
jgi:ligand-binding SRPBCC domain-containing protein